MNRILKTGILVLAVLVFVGCDRLTKNMARNELSSLPTQVYFSGLVRLEYTENPGSFMSLGSDLPEDVRFVLHVTAGLIVVTGIVLLMMHMHRMGRLMLTGFTLLLAGACGNLLDRFLNNGRVIDFIMIDIGQAHTGIFNIADLLITTGMAVLVVSARRWELPRSETRRRL